MPDASVVCSTPVRIQPGLSVQYPEPEVTLDNQGNANVIWRQTASGTGIVSVYSARYAGGAWGAPVLLAADAGHFTETPRIVANQKGDAFAIWFENNNTSNDGHLWATRFTVSGGWSAPVDLQSTGFMIGDARVTIDEAGNGAVVFSQYPALSGSTAIWLTRYSVGSSTWDAPLRIDGYASDLPPTLSPRVAMTADGTILTVWLDQLPAGADVIGMAFFPDGGQLARRAIDNSPNNTTAPNLSASANGTAVAVWQQYHGGLSGNWDVASSRFVPGSGFGDGGLVDFVDGGIATKPAVAVDGAGNAWAAWQELTNQQRARAAYLSPALGWQAFDVDRPITSTSSQLFDVSLDSSGEGLIVWNDGAVVGAKVVAGVAGPAMSLSAGGAIPNPDRPRTASSQGKSLVVYGANDGTNAVWATWCK
jgi:hypothetical protein